MLLLQQGVPRAKFTSLPSTTAILLRLAVQNNQPRSGGSPAMAQEPRRMGGRLKQISDAQRPATRRQTSRLTSGSRSCGVAPEDTPSKSTTPTLPVPAPRVTRNDTASSLLSSVQDSDTAVSMIPAATLAPVRVPQPTPSQIPSSLNAPPSQEASHSSIATRDDAVEDYWYALSHVGGIFRLDSAQYVLQDWDTKAASLMLGSYVHLARLPRGPDNYGTSCTCTLWKATNTCVHDRLLLHRVFDFEALPVIAPTPLPPAVFLQKTPFRDVFIYSSGRSLALSVMPLFTELQTRAPCCRTCGP
ncbi:hypothetical protein NUW54_g13643 [Trametes sanguinea]|uniref:Uncharacterized protein n=1 Tax=Trametes sanguinea TaxID=158606 RepID=A0ACC1MK32_9APHY|nr:hypothetical protein NUW54_g13643 [Trametes sanguinea]